MENVAKWHHGDPMTDELSRAIANRRQWKLHLG